QLAAALADPETGQLSCHAPPLRDLDPDGPAAAFLSQFYNGRNLHNGVFTEDPSNSSILLTHFHSTPSLSP
ncbi:MAG: hypothetical protein WD100_02250, partial [Tistlia sp.]